MHSDISLAAILIVRLRDGEGGSGWMKLAGQTSGHNRARVYVGPRFVLETESMARFARKALFFGSMPSAG